MSAKSSDKKPKPRTSSVRRTRRPRAAGTKPRRRKSELQPATASSVDENDEEPTSEQELGIGSRVVPPESEYQDPDTDPGIPSERPPADDPNVEAQIRDLEARLDGLIRGSANDEPPSSFRATVGKVVERIGAEIPVGVPDAVSELMSSDYYARQWGRLGMRHRSEEVDEFGLDPAYEAGLRPLLEFIYRRWFRIETEGIAEIPAEGRCLVVANHSGTLPLDGVMLRSALRLEHPSARELRWLAEDFVYYLPFVGAFMNRIGAVRACQENAERLLKKGSLVAVFPEGVKGIGKLYRERYRLQRFGRGGFIRLALRTQTPLVPCAIIGAEEANPMLYRVETVSKVLGLPYIPITPTFPALGPLGLLPAPTKWRIVFGEVMRFDGYGLEAADDHVLVGRLAERVRASIQRLVDEGLRKRQSVWLG